MGFLINDREDGKFRRMIKTAFLPMNGHYTTYERFKNMGKIYFLRVMR